ncbi:MULTISPECIES: hypothetical protein [Chryseobacterium]|uniref:Glycine zipper family protein n=1 Tax=Chryseobacterium sediminis TaxID=1679494 RepID=A0A5B2U8Q1_9FLAO|nr:MULTISPECIES: hypothetical protein [Chryseobacterium]KAA2222932.1 hypothetical protein FW780_01655 [Chryseobacterium sediminis]QXU49941.1 hypothetical protein KYG33_02525 [Chryseobacterium sp. D764]
MKKILTVLTIVSLSLFTSCSNNDNNVDDNLVSSKTISNNQAAKSDELTEDELVKQLSTDENFIEYGSIIFSLFENMPNKEGFRTNFNQANFESGKEAYFVELTGYSNDEVSESLDKMNDLLATLYDKYPQLKYNGENKEFIERVIGKADFIVEENLALAGKRNPACQACVTKWKPRMIAATVIGGVVGGASGGFFGAWGGAVIGFVGAGWGAVDCLEAAGC